MYINNYKVTEIAIIICSWMLALLLFAYLKFGDVNDAFLIQWYDKQLFFNRNI